MTQNTNLLNDITRWWAGRDDLGGFRTLGKLKWDLWEPGRNCRPPDRPKDSPASFSILKNEQGDWFFKDCVTGQCGGLVEFLMRDGSYTQSEAILELARIARDAMRNYPEGPRAWLPAPRERHIHFFDPDQLRSYQPENEHCLVGDSHIMRGELFVIGGEPGASKSRAAIALALAGASGPFDSGAFTPVDSRENGPSADGHSIFHSSLSTSSWFGLKVHRQFRTLIIQTENSRSRLRDEFARFNTPPLVPWIRISAPPSFGLDLGNDEFKCDLCHAIGQFKPDCIILDPWNAAAHDSRQRDYNSALDALRSVIPMDIDRPAVGIVAHTRKPRPDQKNTSGSGLMHLLAGSYILTSIPRSVFIITRASDSESDPRILFFNPKNNNGRPAPRSAWSPCPNAPNGFTSLPTFDWNAFDNPPPNRGRTVVTLDHIRALFAASPELELSEAAHRLAQIAGIGKRSTYAALDDCGRFSRHLVREGQTIKFRP